MTLTQLKYIVAVAGAGSISRASRNLYVSQPGISVLIRRAEMECGIRIFRRTKNGVEPTADGNEFLNYAKEVVSAADRLDRRYDLIGAANG